MQLQESGEMYLETIYVLQKEKANVRAIDVGEHMGFSRPSVSRAVNLLKAEGYLTVDEDNFLHLTESGRETAMTIYERHTVLTRLLSGLGVDPKVAEDDACRIEHVISQESFDAIKKAIRSTPESL